jgi:hypothetical protein
MKAKRTPCSPLSSATRCPHGSIQARGTRCPRTQAIPKNTVGALASCRCSGRSSVLWSMVSAPAHGQCPAHGWCSVLPQTNEQACSPAHGQCASLLSALRRMVGAQAHGQYPVHGQCSAPYQCPSALPVLRPMVGAHTENHGQAPRTTLDAAQQGGAGDGKQRPLVPRSRCLPRLTPGVRLQ